MLVNADNIFPVLMAQILLFWLCLRESELHCIVCLVGKVETGLLSCLVPPAHMIWNNCSCSQQVEERQTSLFFTDHIHRYDAIQRSMDFSLQAKQESQRHHRKCLAAPKLPLLSHWVPPLPSYHFMSCTFLDCRYEGQ